MSRSVARPTTGSTGRVLGPWRAAWLRVEAQWTWYRRYWLSNLYSTGLQPLMFLAAMGVGFGSQVEPGPATQGLTYLQYVAPALLVSGALMNAVGEASWPVMSGFKWQKHYLAMTATPITPGEVFGGQLLWIGLRLLLAGAVYALVALLMGAWLNAGAVLVVLIGVLTGVACAAPVMALAASIEREGNAFNALFRFVVMPMTLFAGTFFPIEQIPAVLRPLAWLSPLWHGNELARAATLGGGRLLPVLGHLAFLLVLLAAGSALARARFHRRLVV